MKTDLVNSQGDGQSSQNVLDSFSQIMKILKQSITQFQKLISQKLKKIPASVMQNQITIIKQQLQIISERDCVFQVDTIQYIFPRLIARLRQILEASQVQYLYSQAYNPLKTHVKQAFALTKKFEQEKDLALFSKRLSGLIHRTYLTITNADFSGKDIIKNNFEMIGAHLSQKKQSSQQKNNTQTCLARVLQIVNIKYSLLQGMDVQYSSFRSTVFQSKNKKNEIYMDCFYRNKKALQQHQQYAKLHMKYMKKRESIKRRKSLYNPRRKLKTQAICQNQLINLQKQSPSLKQLNLSVQTSTKLTKKQTCNREQRNINTNPQDKVMIESPALNFSVLHKNFSRINQVKLKLLKKENINFKDSLQLKNIVMTGDYFDRPDSLMFSKHSKQNFYSKRVSSILYRAFEQTFCSQAKRKRVSLRNKLNQS